MRSCTASRAVSTTIGVEKPSRRRRDRISKPSMSGRPMSRIMASKSPGRARASAASPVSAQTA